MQIRQTDVFHKWISRLKDTQGRAKILARIRRLSMGNPGDAKSVGKEVSEMRIDYGPGYRVYYKRQDKNIIILLAGGSKATQSKDIQKALKLPQNL